MNDYHWEKRKIGEIAQVIMGQSPDSKYYSNDEIGLPFLQGCAEFNNRFPKAKLYCSQPKKVGEKGSILFSVRAPVGKINIADRDYIIGRGLAAIKGIKIIQDFLEQYFLFSEEKFRKLSQGSTFESINSEDLSESEIFYPVNKTEQSLIAEILSTVDQAIEQTEAVIAKLQRIKAGLMQDLLTRGIDEQGNIRSEKTHRFKDSPLGRIPVEWEVVELENSLINIIDGDRGKNYPKENEFDSTGFCLFLSAENVTKNGFKFHRAQFINKRKDSLLRKGKLELYDIVLTTRGTVGNFAYYSKQIPYKNIRINSGMVILRNRNKNLSTEFIYYALKDYLFKIEYSIKFSGSAQPQLPIKDLKKFHIIIPKKEEQFKILNVINSFENSLNNELVKLKKLKRLKTALMQDLLTGRVRVTGLLKKRQAEAAVNR